MRLQSVGAKHHPNLVERKPIERLSVFDRGENSLCHLRHNQVFDKERLLKTERRRDTVVERDPLKQSLRKVMMQVIERPAHLDFQAAIHCSGREGHTDQDCLIRRIHRGLPHIAWTRAKARHSKLWLLIRANRPAVVGRCSEKSAKDDPNISASALGRRTTCILRSSPHLPRGTTTVGSFPYYGSKFNSVSPSNR
jgi:hypothetical protein